MVETIIDKYEHGIIQINFYSGKKRLVAVGYQFEEFWFSENAGRRENFEIAFNEHLIGCELDQVGDCFAGVKWLKMLK